MARPKKDEQHKKVTHCVTLAPEVQAGLRERATELGMSMSALMELVLRKYLKLEVKF